MTAGSPATCHIAGGHWLRLRAIALALRGLRLRAIALALRRPPLQLRRILQARVNRLDEHVRSPRAGSLSEADIKVGGESGGLDLIESGAVFNHGLNTVTDDDQHVAIFGNLPFIGDASVSRDYPCPAVLIVLIECSVEDEVQSANFPLEAASVFHINERILRCREDVAGNNDIGAPEMDDAVAVRTGVRHREDLYRFVIVV